MFFFTKLKDETEDAGRARRNRPPLRRSETFSRADVFRTWAKDSFLNESTIDVLVQTHQIDCLPAVLALRVEDIAELGLAVGQQRLLEDAVRKLHDEYELVRPPTPRTKINLDQASYKTLIDTEKAFDFGSSARTTEADFERFKAETDGEKYDPTSSQTEGRKMIIHERPAEHWRPRARLIGEEVGEDNCLCACQRWLLVAILMPLLFVIASVGSVLVVLLMPFRCCCGQGGCYSAVVSFMFDCLIMSPCRACQWASGAREQESAEQEPGTKSSYGGTITAALGEGSE